MEENKSWSLGFEFLDIEIIDHKKEKNTEEKWACDQCRLFFLSKDKLIEHKKKHERSLDETVNCKYCNKILSNTEDTKECYSNKKCETCEYRCSKCPKRFLRHSSLLNHEKNHLLMKKRKNKCNERLINRINKTKTTKALKRGRPKKIATEEFSKGFKNKQPSEERCPKKKRIKSEEPLGKKVKRSVKSFGVLQKEKNSSRKSRQNTSIINTVEPLDKTLTNNENISKRSLTKSNTLHKDPETPGTSKQIPKTSNTVSNTPLGVSSSENVVNYKPFSCHVCGETFASDNALLQHIRSHGENAVSNFRCKHCGDEFDDIYKMQYHLAICPLAEDDLESTLKQSIPRRFTTPNLPSGIRKRGRPKKTPSSDLKSETPCSEIKSEITSDSEEYNKSLCIRGGLRKRKHEQTGEHSKKMLKNTPVSKQIANIKSSISKNESDDNNVESDSYDNGPMNDDCSDSANPIDDSFETSDDERRKLHACPFPNCGIKFTREKALLCHMRNHTDDFDDSLKCHICDIPFEDVQSLRSHINICKGIKEEKDDDFDEQNYAEKNEYVDKPNHTFQQSKGYFICKVCGRTYLTEEKLKRCFCLQKKQPGRSLVCRLCSVKCEDEKRLQKHFRSIHPTHFPYKCLHCSAEFDSKSAEYEHKLIHVEDEEDLKCVVCSAKLPTYKDLYFHYTKDHVQKCQNICLTCNKLFPHENELNEHNLQHKKEPRFKCMFCSKTFNNGGYLNIHSKIHTNKKIYKCKICYRAFLDSRTLFKHMLFHASMPTGDRHLKCCICLISFSQNLSLESHIKNCHLKKKTDSVFECPLCKESTQDQKVMSCHLVNHSMSISQKTMSEVEFDWVKKLGCKSDGGKPQFPARTRGRPRKCLLKCIEQKTLSPEEAHHAKTYNTRTHQSVKKLKNENLFNEGKYLRVKNGKQCDEPKLQGKKLCKKGNRIMIDNTKESHLKLAAIESSPLPFIFIESQTNLETSASLLDENDSGVRNECEISNVKTSHELRKQQEFSEDKKIMAKLLFEAHKSKNKVVFNKNEDKIKSPKIEKITTQVLLSNTSSTSISTFKSLKYKNVTLPEEQELKNEISVCSIENHANNDTNVKPEISDVAIKEKKYFEPSLGLTKYSCTTCILSFSSQEELLSHNTLHIF